MNQEQIRCYILQNGTDWVMWQGVWDHWICGNRNICDALLKTCGSTLNAESLRTLMTEAETIIYSRKVQCI